MLASTRALLSQDVLPTALVFGVVVWTLGRYPRAARRSFPPVAVSLRRQLGHIAATIAGGYLVFVLLTAGISLLAGDSLDYVGDSLVGGAALAFGVVGPIFAGGAALARQVSSRTGTVPRSRPG